jgi:hypothetical protein
MKRKIKGRKLKGKTKAEKKNEGNKIRRRCWRAMTKEG